MKNDPFRQKETTSLPASESSSKELDLSSKLNQTWTRPDQSLTVSPKFGTKLAQKNIKYLDFVWPYQYSLKWVSISLNLL